MYNLLLIEYTTYRKNISKVLVKVHDKFDIFETLQLDDNNIIEKGKLYKFI